MKFHSDKDTIENSVDDKELEQQWRRQIEHSPTWIKHQQQHEDAQLVNIESSPLEKNENPVVKYDNETGKFPTMTCNCGVRFELHSDTHKVYMSNPEPAQSGQPQDASDYGKKTETNFFSYKN